MITRSDRVGILFLGCGWAARIHSRVLRRFPNVECSYASRDRARAEAARDRYDGRAAYGSYDDGLADPATHVAIIATPTATHRELATRALGAGKHVIVEKPAFMTSADVDAVRAAADAAGRRVFVAENYAYKPITRYLRELVEGRTLGDLRFVSLNATKRQSTNGWRGDPSLSGGGALFEAGVHWVSFASSIGLEVCDLSAHRAGCGRGADLSSLVVFRFTNGAVGTLAHSWELAAPLGGARVSKIQGTAGAVTFESNGFGAVTTGRRRSVRTFVRDSLGYRAMHTDFLDALRSGRSPAFTLDMAQRDLRWLEVAARSMEG
jgi:predicted dehydrogenase